MTISPEQCRAARALLDWSQAKLAKASGVGKTTIIHFEGRTRKPYASTRQTLRATLEAAGIIFIDGDKVAGSGLRLREPEEE